ncbi:MAG TPA: Fic family protein [Cytophaga sp.]|nr:Fic family protein [Cytophaga sp.]
MRRYIYQRPNWPDFTWDNERLLVMLGQVRNMQGRLFGRMEGLGFELRDEATLSTLTMDVLKSSEIEGELLPPDQVRSSVARQLGMDVAGLVHSDRNVDGVVEMVLDATQQYQKPLSAKRLFDWHTSLFPTGRSGMHAIEVGQWRTDSTGPMQVVSGTMGKEHVHFQAPAANVLKAEMKRFVDWFNKEKSLDPVLKAGVAHLWFVTVHPFDDGNGRIARALTDMLLARSDCSPQRFYSMSAQIRVERKAYYDTLEKTQQGSLDVTDWLGWFLTCLMHALQATDTTLSTVLLKAAFWKKHRDTVFNDRQKLLLNKLFNNFDGKLTSTKWAKIAKCSADTALRDIQDLMSKGVLEKAAAGGRSTGYVVKY